ncbi:hypothetical protein [uncultured Pseudonocardia sp.]|uniref:hypothetical protein n=1 Tax=uncultured Pseudonocardia sp. TaxID=211455 RepID=UPI0026017184|nr:hypothetical protein [uncultured Pseudonocardia sp.]
MPRKRPSRLRTVAARPATRAIPGVPLATTRALDRLDRPEISSLRVIQALETCQRTASLPAATLSAPYNDWTELIGPMARDELERALRALPTRQAAALRVLVARADAAFRVKTLNNPRADPSQPWWARRWSH